MEYLVGPSEGVWVSVAGRLAGSDSLGAVKERVKSRTLQVNTWFFDLDDNHVKSPGKAMAKRALGTSHFSPEYWAWCAQALFAVASGDRMAESRLWNKYCDSFLESSLDEVVDFMDGERSSRLVYPGVEDFLSLVSGSKRYYVTRNLDEVAGVYADMFGFDGCFTRVDDKAGFVEEFTANASTSYLYGVEGDSECDAEMVAALRYHGKDVVGILTSDSPAKYLDDTVWDINISKNHEGLVKLLTS